MIVDGTFEISIKLPEILRRPVLNEIHRLSLNVLFADGLNTYGITEGWRAAIEVQIRICDRCGALAHEWTYEKRFGCQRHRWVADFETIFERFGDSPQEAIDNLGAEVARHRDAMGGIKYTLPGNHNSRAEEHRRWYETLERWYEVLEEEMRALVSR